MLLDNTVPTIEMGPLEHDCVETIDTIYSTGPDLGSEPLSNAEEEWLTDGSSFIQKVKKLAGYTVTSQT